MKRLQLGVLASGRGSNFEAILDHIKTGALSADVRALVSNRKSAGALDIAKHHNIPRLALSRKDFSSDEAFDQRVLDFFRENEVNFVVLAGYLRLLTPVLIHPYRNRILNIHPALLPSFGGKGMFGHHVHEAVLEYGCKVSGVTVHLVDEVYDSGPIVLQRCVPVENNDTPDTLAARILKQEHRIFSEALQLFAEEKIVIKGRRVYVQSN
ncbi:MAG: phosphoribosylglycinamide formyltransferase [Calditrichaeota bacterium]|nr:phosphoribosylglycinamide formyltransferase [Calditrichota bacterium]